MEQTNPHRLPTIVLPSRYAVTLRPDIPAASFAGNVSITAEASEATTTIVMNAIELDIRSAVVRHGDATQTAAIALDEATERLTLTLSDAVGPGEITIDIEFDGVLNDKLRGFYRSSFTDDDGTEHTIATLSLIHI